MSIVVFPLIGLAYSGIISSVNWLPLVITIPWLAAFYGYCLGYVVQLLLYRNNIKASIKQNARVLMVSFILAYYFHWVFWVLIVEQGSLWTWLFNNTDAANEFIEFFKNPSELINRIVEINSTGTWELDDDDLQIGKIKGLVLWFFWLCELLLMLVFLFFVKPNPKETGNED